MSGKRLLVVDDEPRFAAFVRRVAKGLGYNVEVTTRGRDFQSAYEREMPDVVIVDMVIPDIDGNELVLWLVEKGCEADILIITGYSPDYANNARILGEFKGLKSVTTMSKPISVTELRKALAFEGT